MNVVWLLQATVLLSSVSAFATRVAFHQCRGEQALARARFGGSLLASTQQEGNSLVPTINGKRIIPYKVVQAGLNGEQKVSAVFATLNDRFKPRTEGWEAVSFVGITEDLKKTLETHYEEQGKQKVAYVRALTFSSLQLGAMQDMARSWRTSATEAGAAMETTGWTLDALEFVDDDDDDEDEDDWMEMTANAMAVMSGSASNDDTAEIVSPFEQSSATNPPDTDESPHELGSLPLTIKNIDKVLEEVRPYLISDGGNVSVERVDEVSKNVYLKLEGACGSCPSSTVTMQMGIERVLKENFPDLGQVLQVEDESAPTELTLEAVEAEVDRLKPAITAMGGVVEILSIDPIGVVELRFRGASKVQQGLELALLDVPFVKHVKFTST